MGPNPKRDKSDQNPDKRTGKAGPVPKGNAEKAPHSRRPLSSGRGQGPPPTPGGKSPKNR